MVRSSARCYVAAAVHSLLRAALACTSPVGWGAARATAFFVRVPCDNGVERPRGSVLRTGPAQGVFGVGGALGRVVAAGVAGALAGCEAA